jgi:hypothetical protein
MGKKNTWGWGEGAKLKGLCSSPVDCRKVIQKVDAAFSSLTLVSSYPGFGTQEANKLIFTTMIAQFEQRSTNILTASVKWFMS